MSKSIIQFFKQFLNKPNKKKYNRRIRFRRYNPINNQLNSRIAPLGRSGVTKLITGTYTENINGNVAILINDLANTREYLQLYKDWSLVKLQKISVTFYPDNLNTTSDPIYMRINWDGVIKTNLSILDDVKIVPAFRTSFRTYFSPVPKIEVSGGTNLGVYFPIDEFSLIPTTVQLTSSVERLINFRVDVEVHCKVPIDRENTKKIDGDSRVLHHTNMVDKELITTDDEKIAVDAVLTGEK